MPTAVLFDLDDTLLDRAATLAVYAVQFARDMGSALPSLPPKVLEAAIRAADAGGYRPRSEMAADLAARLPWRFTADPVSLLDHWLQTWPRLAQGAEGFDDILTVLQSRRIRTGLITNGGTRSQNLKIDALQLRHRLEVIIISEEVGMAKPDPAIFHLAAKGLGASPSELWYVGDHPVNDILGAAAAGLTPVWLRRSFAWPSDQPEPALQLNRLTDLLSLLPSKE